MAVTPDTRGFNLQYALRGTRTFPPLFMPADPTEPGQLQQPDFTGGGGMTMGAQLGTQLQAEALSLPEPPPDARLPFYFAEALGRWTDVQPARRKARIDLLERYAEICEAEFPRLERERLQPGQSRNIGLFNKSVAT
eukprot:5254770-Pleurochrysis_carterae.AAC.3